MFDRPDRLAQLEAILHPLVRRRERRFAAAAARRGVALLVLDIPLLFESGEERRCDATAVVSAPAFVQRARALRRPGMTPEKLAAILERQMPDAEKRAPRRLRDRHRPRAAFELAADSRDRHNARRLAAPPIPILIAPWPPCVRSCSTPKPPASTRARATVSSEIGCIELVNHIPTGEVFHSYLNPGREMSRDAFAVHGLDDAFLAKQKAFADIAEAFLAFVGRATLVIHNAEFDLGFINHELGLIHRGELEVDRVIDTLELARHKFPGAPASLDALCRRFGIDNSKRAMHGAMLDAELLSLRLCRS